MKKVIEISGVTLEVEFTFSTFKKLGKLWGKKTLKEVMEHVTLATSGHEENNVAFDSMEVFSDIVSVFDKEDKLSEDEIQDHLFANPEVITLLVEAFINSLVVNESEEVKKK